MERKDEERNGEEGRREKWRGRMKREMERKDEERNGEEGRREKWRGRMKRGLK